VVGYDYNAVKIDHKRVERVTEKSMFWNGPVVGLDQVKREGRLK